MNNKRPFINRNLEKSGRSEKDCNHKSQESKRGSKLINVRVSSLAGQMNSDTDFPMDENLINISFLACRVPLAKSSQAGIPDDMRAM